ncbi:MAG: methionyl-tRNA formyltransferase, partial [Bdellovibrionota bacterium]
SQMSKIRIVFLGTPEFAAASLRRLIADDHFEIAAVVSQPDRPAGRKMQLKASPVKELAISQGLKVYTPETVNTEEFRNEIASYGAESAAVVAFGQILGQKFLDLFPRGCVNVHGSVLPRWRGAAPIQRAIMAGDEESGVALQVVVKKLDAGPLLGVRRVSLGDEMNAVQLHDKLKELGADLLHVEYMDYLRGHLTPVAQDEAGVTIAPKIDKSEARIDWTKSAREIHNLVRGLAMGPLPFAVRGGQALKILNTRVLDDGAASGPVGTFRAVTTDGVTHLEVNCGLGLLAVADVQPESRSRMSVADYLRGQPATGGDRFEVGSK